MRQELSKSTDGNVFYYLFIPYLQRFTSNRIEDGQKPRLVGVPEHFEGEGATASFPPTFKEDPKRKTVSHFTCNGPKQIVPLASVANRRDCLTIFDRSERRKSKYISAQAGSNDTLLVEKQ